MESAILMFLLVIIIISRFLLWSCLSTYIDYKLAKRFPDKLKNE
ncbi:small integral membrane protein 38 [Spea bombifrons]|nr:small integral membrane protein 38 [Spea bombifrons]